MDKADHMLTKSWGSWNSAKKYRALQERLIDQGKFFEAVKMDLDDIRGQFGTKYEKAIQQMLDHMAQDLEVRKLNYGSSLTIQDLRRP
jgi:filamentous hemagglutinin